MALISAVLPAGPYGVNGTPLRRLAQAYVIATQTKVDISTVKIPDSLNDDFFKRAKGDKKKKDGDLFSDSKKVNLQHLCNGLAADMTLSLSPMRGVVPLTNCTSTPICTCYTTLCSILYGAHYIMFCMEHTYVMFYMKHTTCSIWSAPWNGSVAGV